jgi:hypothetical protein
VEALLEIKIWDISSFLKFSLGPKGSF